MNKTETVTDQELIERSKKDHRAFEGLYERYFEQIYRFVIKRVNEPTVSADIAQQVFFNALTRLSSYREMGHPYSSYLHRIAINLCNEYFRKSKNQRFVLMDDALAESLIQSMGCADAEHLQREAALIQALEQLKSKELMLVELRFFEGYSFKEIGYLSGITENSAKVKTYRILKKLKRMIDGHGK
ncbi:RNA polymerase sigma factor [Marinoscillum furvescens]|uniref:RNA polymerase sigma-70 factor (ECF subfamily) n=1 Tax=Marinoscillum furvescens DSM 4134 TaxID=1122208 RepID=A0A3D9KX97_MARFU|nr:sigma-70 family RNA polymerase sigma factor [Marinoscillum furvescens]RED92225.1 RNA polymerase sigma-70 factor (ECF subfamily) [Marinoscillum furvescens DSM 4134]